MELDILHDARRQRFVVDLDGDEGYLSYREREDGLLDYTHTYVPPEHRGRCVGEEIVLHALEHARDEGVRVIPNCPFVSHVPEEHPEYREIVSEGERKALPGNGT